MTSRPDGNPNESPVPDPVAVEVRAWAATPGGAKFCAALWRRLSRGRGGGFVTPLRLGPLTDTERVNIDDLFGRRAWHNQNAIRLDVADGVLREGRLGFGLRQLITVVRGQVVTQSEARRARTAAQTEEVRAARQALADTIEGILELTDEHIRLQLLGNESKWVVPADSRTGCRNWKTYDQTLRIAAVYYRWPRSDGKIPEQRLATSALHNSKIWTPASRMAFQRLISKGLGEVVELRDRPVRVCGPLTWQVDNRAAVLADFVDPWVGLPIRALIESDLGTKRPRGLLLVENSENFEQVCRNTSVPETWLVVWSEGYTGDLDHQLIQRFPDIPIAAWCDVDPHGIGIIGRAQNAISRFITPIGMDVELWRTATRDYHPDAEARAKCRRAAEEVARVAPASLKALLDLFRDTGCGVEQQHEAIYDAVLPGLPALLKELERSHPVS
jgi:hypothetical protein